MEHFQIGDIVKLRSSNLYNHAYLIQMFNMMKNLSVIITLAILFTLILSII